MFVLYELEAAYIGMPGRFLANSLEISPGEDVLFVMFDSGIPLNFGAESILGIRSTQRVASMEVGLLDLLI